MKFRNKAHRHDFHRDTMCFFNGATLVLTEGVRGLDDADRDKVLGAVVEFKFTATTEDPYGEHDFGKVTIDGTDYFRKFDDWSAAPPEMLPAGQGPLMMTVMRADEY